MNRKLGLLLAGALVGILAVEPVAEPLGGGHRSGDDHGSTTDSWR